jgi:hypothetical protein
MKEFMYLFRGGDAGRAQQSPEEMQAHMQKWGVWMKELADSGNLVAGLPLHNDGKVVEKSGEVITDGPFTEGKEIVGGYLIVKANDLNHAAELSKGCPIFEHGGTTEVREILPM